MFRKKAPRRGILGQNYLIRSVLLACLSQVTAVVAQTVVAPVHHHRDRAQHRSSSPLVFYVDPSAGLDGNSGTSPLAAWRTTVRAVKNTYAPGDQLLLKGGSTCRGSLIFRGLPPSVISSYGTGQATLRVPAGSNGIQVTDYGNCTVANLIISGPATVLNYTRASIFTFGILFTLDGKAKEITYPGVAITGNTVSGFVDGTMCRAIVFGPSFSGLSIVGNTVHDCPGNGIWVTCLQTQASQYITGDISWNTVYNCPSPSFATFGGCGIVPIDMQYSTVEHNVIHDCGANNSQSSGPGGIVCVHCSYTQVRGNEAYNISTANQDAIGFDLDGGCQFCELADNYSHNNQGSGYFLFNYTAGTRFVNTGNTVHHNLSINDASRHGGSLQVGGTCTNWTFYNNSVYQATRGHPVIYLDPRPNSTATNTGAFLNNIFYAKNEAVFFDWASSPATSLGQISLLGNDYVTPDRSATYAIIAGQSTQSTLAGLRSLGYETLAGEALGSSASPGWTVGLGRSPSIDTGTPSTLQIYDVALSSELMHAGVPNPILSILYAGLSAVAPELDFHGTPMPTDSAVGAVTYPDERYSAPSTSTD